MTAVRIAAVIPARMGSSRFPGKPLLDFHGLPMVEHVRRRALLMGAFSEVVVATCDRPIVQAIEKFGGRVILTSPSHPAASDRVAEAAGHLDCTHVLNVQGDEILVLPDDLRSMAEAMTASPARPAWNAVALIEEQAELTNRSIVKCVVSRSNRILFCQRDFSTFGARDLKEPFDPVRVILGILGYEKRFLMRFGSLPRTPGEIAESIDQNRIIEHNVELWGVRFSKAYPSVNEPRDASLVEKFLEIDPRQKNVLEQILKKQN
jgi:3-deoxy-manno-octulosonate cytidylyltransferase (CMP-KDO synthetase)